MHDLQRPDVLPVYTELQQLLQVLDGNSAQIFEMGQEQRLHTAIPQKQCCEHQC